MPRHRTMPPGRRARLGIAVAAAATFAGTTGFTPRRESAASAQSSLSLSASLSERRLYIHDGEQTVAYDVAVGKDSRPTPTGSFTIRKIVWNPAWVPPDERWARGSAPQPPGAARNPMKVVKMFFREPDYYIHGTGDVESLGEAASHGCLRMHPDDAYRVARYLMEHGGQPRDESWFQRVWHFRSETKTVYLDSPIPLTITD